MIMFLQFELWKQCSVGCKFCYNKGIKFKRDKIKSMQFIIDKLNDFETDNYDRIGLIAGEIFNGELSTAKEKELFYDIMNILTNKLKSNKIKEILITSSMIYNNTKDIIEFCEYLKTNDIIDKVMICTSYDIIGRFNITTENIWKTCMKLLHERYPNLMIHIEMILTQSLLEAVINKQFDPRNFTKLYGSRVDYIVPFTGYGKLYTSKQEFEKVLPGFFPKRETFFKFLSYVYNNGIFSKEYLKDFLNITLHSDTVYTALDDITFTKIDHRHENENKKIVEFPLNFGGYIDSNIHPREDVEMFLKMIGE